MLDTKTLGGAGFASQTTSGEETWDLSGYDGVEVEVVTGDGKRYTLIVKDEVPEGKREDGRERSGVNWECDFEAGGEQAVVWVPWGRFKAVYRGVEKPDAGPLRTGEIKRFSLMCRRYVNLFDESTRKHAKLGGKLFWESGGRVRTRPCFHIRLEEVKESTKGSANGRY